MRPVLARPRHEGVLFEVHDAVTTFDGLAPAVLVLAAVSVLSGSASLAVRVLSPRPLGSASVLGGPLVDMTLVFCALFAAYLVFTPQPESVEHVRLPLGDDVRSALRAEPGDLHPWLQLVGNVLLLFPLAALLPLRSGWLDGPVRIVVAGALTALLVELVQFLFIEGRVASSDDVVLNTAGAVAGAVVGTLGARRRRVIAVESGAQHSATGRGRYPVWWLIAEVEQEGVHRTRTRRATNSLGTAVAAGRSPEPPGGRTPPHRRPTTRTWRVNAPLGR